MKKFAYLLFALLFAFAPIAQAKDTSDAELTEAPAAAPAPAKPHYIDPTKVDLKTLLPEPPADGSPENQKDLDAVLEKQKDRTSVDVARAKEEVKLKVFIFSEVLGPWFNAKDLPVTAAFFQNVTDDSKLVSDQGKKIWNRPRPFLQSKDVKPAVDLEQNGSYPSGHSTRGMLFALILADLAPDLKDKLIARGEQVGEDRVIAGLHFPSDVAAGQTLGKDLYTQFTASPAFQADLAKVKAEFDAAKAKH